MSTEAKIMSQGVKVPQPKRIKVKAGELRKLFPKLGKTQLARVGDEAEWDIAAVKNEIRERGFDPDAGPTPCAEEGAEYLLDGNQRCSAAAELAEETPDLYGKLNIEILIYPKLTDEQRVEILNRASRSTNAFTVWDHWKQSMLRWRAHPDEDQLEHFKAMGVKRNRTFFPGCVNDAVLVKTPNGLEIKPGLRADDVWGKGKGGNKQGPVQVGKALSRAHPRVVEAFFAARNDPTHSVTYREVIEHNAAWESDCKLRPDLAAPPADFETLATEFPESKLVATLGPRLVHGKSTQPGRGEGKGRMSKKDVEGAMVTFNHSRAAVILLHYVERDPGYQGDDFIRDAEVLYREIEASLTPRAVEAIVRINNRAGAAAVANAKASAEAEASKKR